MHASLPVSRWCSTVAQPQENNMMDSVKKRSVCPHDCPSVCALDVEILDDRTIGKVYGAKDHPYTDGVICAKVARYAERVHHPDRCTRS